MHSKRSLEGYLLIDHSATMGADGFGRKVEAPTLTCSHCHRQIIVQPLRTRERPYCRKCDHYICDSCAVVMTQTLTCEPLTKTLDRMQEQAIIQLNR